MELLPAEDGWQLPVTGQLVTRCCVDNEEVRFFCQNMVEIAIGEPFTMLSADGRRYSLDPAPGSDAATLAPFLRIMRQSILTGVALHDGRLEVLFQGGGRIEVPPGADFEAWTLAGPGGLKVVCLPGGGLAIWSAGESPAT